MTKITWAVEEYGPPWRLMALADDESETPQNRSALRLAIGVINVLSMTIANQRDGNQVTVIEDAIAVVQEGFQP